MMIAFKRSDSLPRVRSSANSNITSCNVHWFLQILNIDLAVWRRWRSAGVASRCNHQLEVITTSSMASTLSIVGEDITL
jgi:hypothetical protein